MSTLNPTPLPWHQRGALALTFAILSLGVLVVPYTIANVLLATWGL